MMMMMSSILFTPLYCISCAKLVRCFQLLCLSTRLTTDVIIELDNKQISLEMSHNANIGIIHSLSRLVCRKEASVTHIVQRALFSHPSYLQPC